jgi:hypothetical protein
MTKQIKTTKGNHYWGLLSDKLLIVLDTWDWFTVCWEWECTIPYNDVTIIAEINRPVWYEETKLYYI